jgi:serine/threonine protein kinase
MMETLAATWLSDAPADQSAHAVAAGPIGADTVALSQPGFGDPSAGGAGAATIPLGLEEPADGGRKGLASIADSDADFLSAVAKASAGQPELPEAIPPTLGGYTVQKALGRGGMGTVYLARQLSLGRDVALKVMAPEWARDPAHVARFTREAYAAAQLVHHNIVQIYDFGADKGVHYFSMEYVEGQTLADQIRTDGTIAPEVAVSQILQAARGLKVAHDHGMIHRDVKPENLMLNRYGVIKVADLGLVRFAGSGDVAAVAPADGASSGVPAIEPESLESLPNITRVRVAMGTPAYMAPEQARDAANVGHRADIYSLGCTLYALVTGRPPFQGKTALEVITKHQVEPVTPPDAVVAEIPRALSDIILKMVAKNPDERYQTIDEVITAFEGFLKTEKSAPRPDEAQLLEQCVQALDSSPSARLGKWVSLGFVLACGAGIVWALVAGQSGLAGLVLGTLLFTPLFYAIKAAGTRQAPLYLKVRQVLLDCGPSERAALAIGFVVLLLLLFATNWLWFCATVALLSFLLASAGALLINRNRARERREPVEAIQNMLKSMRLRGLDEETLRRFLAERCGPRWDAVRNALFGYEEHLVALEQWGRAEWQRARPKLARWREAALAWIEPRLQARHDARARLYLQQVEEESLKAQGKSFFEARRQARRVADALVTQAKELHTATLKSSRALIESLASDQSRQRMFQKLRAAAEEPERLLGSMERGLLARRSEESLTSLLGPRTRFIAGVVLIFGYVIWLFQNSAQTADRPTEPLWLPLVPSLVAGVIRDANSAIAGLILIASVLVPGWRISLVLIPAAAVALLGTTLGIPASLSLAGASALAALGFFLARPRAAASAASEELGS